MMPGFWSDFLSHLLATVIGVVIGVPIALWIHHRALMHREERRRASDRDEVAHAVDVLTLALEANRPRLQRLAQAVAQHQALYDSGLDASAWDAVQPFLTSDLGSSAIRPRLAYHFSRVAAVRGLSDLLMRYTVGAESVFDGAPQLRQQLHAAIGSAATELDREAGELAAQLQQGKSGLPAPN
jgi:hypothetical protein